MNSMAPDDGESEWRFPPVGNCRPLDLGGNTPLQGIASSIFQAYLSDADGVPDLHSAQTILATSDYSGDHKGSPFSAMSFLLADIAGLSNWERRRHAARARLLGIHRRMAYKSLNDRYRRRALVPWLDAADLIPGVLFSVAIEKQLGSLFAGTAPLDLSNPNFGSYRNWPRPALERAFRAAHFLGLLLGTLARPNQDVLWFTDEDDIASNATRLRELTNIAAWVTSGYLSFSLRHLRCGTTASDDGSRFLEDMASIPDLIAGALAELMAAMKRESATFLRDREWVSSTASSKARLLLVWAGRKRLPLKRLTFVIQSGADQQILISRLCSRETEPPPGLGH